MEPTRVLIVEDQALPRQLFQMFVESCERYELVQTLESAAMADVVCAGKKVDLIVMDIMTKNGASGLTAAEKIKQKYPAIRVILVTSMPEYSWIERAKQAGVDSFWYKEISPQPLLELMDRTMAGERIYPDAPMEVTLGLASSSELTAVELSILRELTGGATNKEIAAKLHMSPNTVRNYLQVISDKTGLHNRTELAVKARKSGLVILEEAGELI